MKLFTYLDAPEAWQITLQDPATPVMEGIIDFHNDLMFYLILIVTFVTWLLVRCVYLYHSKKQPLPEKFVHGTVIEIVWTIIPAVVLMFIAMPSFALLYSIEEVVDPAMTIKVIGHQWYWSYEYGFNYFSYDNNSVQANEIDEDKNAFDAYMIPENDLTKGALRLLETDRRLVLPEKTHIRCIVTSADVLHSWAIPSFGVKIDACPGRLNQTTMFVKRSGVFYGQCSEICGINHGFMPIVIQVVPQTEFLEYISN